MYNFEAEAEFKCALDASKDKGKFSVKCLPFIQRFGLLANKRLARLPSPFEPNSFIYYCAPDVTVNMVAAYHCLDGERSMHHKLKIRT